jgi:hypothetical protein
MMTFARCRRVGQRKMEKQILIAAIYFLTTPYIGSRICPLNPKANPGDAIVAEAPH